MFYQNEQAEEIARLHRKISLLNKTNTNLVKELATHFIMIGGLLDVVTDLDASVKELQQGSKKWKQN